MPESTIAIVGRFCEPESFHSGRTPEAVGHTWFEVGADASSIVASLVIVRPGILASARTFLALIVTATELRKSYWSFTCS